MVTELNGPGAGRTRRLRVSIFQPHFADGGLERMTIVLAQELQRKDYHVEIVTLDPRHGFVEELPTDLPLVDLGHKRVRGGIVALSRYLRRSRPHLFISNQSYANTAAALAHTMARSQAKLVMCERTDPLADSHVMPAVFSWAKLRLARWAYGRADAIVANSQGVAQSLAKMLFIQEQRISVIYNPAVVPGLDALANAAVDHPWLLPGQPPVILGTGRLTPQKDFFTLVRAFAILLQSLPARLIILGDGADRTELEKLTEELGIRDAVDLPGFTPNPYSFMARAAVFALSSKWEGLGNVLVEAQATGTPVVSTDCPSGPREVLLDGEAGLLVPVGSPPALAGALRRILEDQDLADRLVTRAQGALDRFLPGPCAARYLELTGLPAPPAS